MRYVTWLRCTLLLVLGVMCLAPAQAQRAEQADQALEAAKVLFDRGVDDLAMKQCTQFLKDYPRATPGQLADAYTYIGRLYQRQNPPDWAQAMSAYAQALAKATDPALASKRAEAQFYIGDCYLQQEMYDKAGPAFGEALAQVDRNTPEGKDRACQAQYWFAECAYQQQQYDTALKEFAKVPEIDAQHNLAAWALYSIGWIELREPRKHYAAAITALERVMRDYPKSEAIGETTLALAYAYVGRAHERPKTELAEQRNELWRATDLFQTVIDQKDPADASDADKQLNAQTRQKAATAQGQAYFDLGNLDDKDPKANFLKAVDAYALAIKGLDTVDAAERAQAGVDLHLWRGHALYNADRLQDAIAEYQVVADQAAKFKDKALDALFWQGTSWYRIAKAQKNDAYTKAVDTFNRFLTLAPDDARAAKVSLLIAYAWEDQVDLNVIDAGSRAVAAAKQIIERYANTQEANDANDVIARIIMKTMSLDDLQKEYDKGDLKGRALWTVALQLARKLYDAKRYADAIVPAQRVLNDTSDPIVEAQAAYLAGASYQMLGKPMNAEPFYARVRTLKGADSNLVLQALRGLVQAYLELGKTDAANYAKARDAATELLNRPELSKDPNLQASTYIHLGEAYIGTKEYDRAMGAYEKVTKDFATSDLVLDAQLGIAWLCEKADPPNRDRAIQVYRDLIARFKATKPEMMPKIYFRLGVNLSESKQFTAAIEALQQVAADSKEFADQSLYAVAWAFRYNGDNDTANKKFKELIEKFPASPLVPDAYMRVGEFYMKDSKYAEALPYMKSAYGAMQPDNPNAALIAYKYGVCAYNTQQYDDAAAAFGKATDDTTFEFKDDAIFWRGQSLEKSKVKDAAKNARLAYLLYLERAPQGNLVLDAALGAGRAALANKDYDQARTDLKSVLDRCDNVDMANADLVARGESVKPEAKFLIGQSFYEQKEYGQALERFAFVIVDRKEPWYSRAFTMMARCNLERAKAYQQANQPALAQKERTSAQNTLRDLVTFLLKYKPDSYKQTLDEIRVLANDNGLDVPITDN